MQTKTKCQKKNKRTHKKGQKTKQSRGADNFLQFLTKSTKKKSERHVTPYILPHSPKHVHAHASAHTHRLNERSQTRPQWNNYAQNCNTSPVLCVMFTLAFPKSTTPRFALSTSSSQWKNEQEEEKWCMLEKRTTAPTSEQPDPELGRKSSTVYGKSRARCRNSVTQR